MFTSKMDEHAKSTEETWMEASLKFADLFGNQPT